MNDPFFDEFRGTEKTIIRVIDLKEKISRFQAEVQAGVDWLLLKYYFSALTAPGFKICSLKEEPGADPAFLISGEPNSEIFLTDLRKLFKRV